MPASLYPLDQERLQDPAQSALPSRGISGSNVSSMQAAMIFAAVQSPFHVRQWHAEHLGEDSDLARFGCMWRSTAKLVETRRSTGKRTTLA